MSKPQHFAATEDIVLKDMTDGQVYAFDIAPMIYDTVLGIRLGDTLHIVWVDINNESMGFVEDYMNTIKDGEVIHVVSDLDTEIGTPTTVDFSDMTFDSYYHTLTDQQPDGDPMIYLNQEHWCGHQRNPRENLPVMKVLKNYAQCLEIEFEEV